MLLWCHLSLFRFRLREFYPLRLNVPVLFDYRSHAFAVVRNPAGKPAVWPLPRSLAATWGIEFSFSSSGYLDVSVPRVAFLPAILFTGRYLSITSGEFPHSEICGSTDICSSPQLFAACHVLLRLPVPRHPPCALSCLISRHASALLHGLLHYCFRSLVNYLWFSLDFVIVYYPSVISSFVVFCFLVSILYSVFRVHTNLRSCRLVENKGLEPLTPCVQGRCSPS